MGRVGFGFFVLVGVGLVVVVVGVTVVVVTVGTLVVVVGTGVVEVVVGAGVVLVVVVHKVCAVPALAVVGVADTVSVAVLLFKEGEQPLTVTTQR